MNLLGHSQSGKSSFSRRFQGRWHSLSDDAQVLERQRSRPALPTNKSYVPGIVLARLHFKIFSSGVPGPEIPRQSDQHKSTKLFREAEASLVTRQDMTLVLKLGNSLVNRGAKPHVAERTRGAIRGREAIEPLKFEECKRTRNNLTIGSFSS